MSDATLYTIDINFLLQTAKDNPTLYKNLLLESGRRLQGTLNSLENIMLRSPYSRVAHRLIYLADQFGEKLRTGTKITFPVTDQDLADMLDIDPETISDCLHSLGDKGFIKDGKNIIIPDIEKLKEEAHK
jgi:CRP-like cAMP-binding protein